MQTVMFSSAILVNGRQIGHPTKTEDGKYLVPNDLLLFNQCYTKRRVRYNMQCVRRFRFLQQVIDGFWNQTLFDTSDTKQGEI